MFGGSARDRRKWRRAVAQTGANQTVKPAPDSFSDPPMQVQTNQEQPKHWREFALAGVGLLVEALALLFGIFILTLAAAVLFWFALRDYKRERLGTESSWYRIKFGLITGTLLLVLTTAVPMGVKALIDRHSRAHPSPSVVLRPPTEEEMLCPHPLTYSLREFPKPKENNYSTELTVRNEKELMLTVDIYMRTLYSQAFLTYPPNQHDQVIALEQNAADLSHLRLGMTKGLPEFRLEIHTFQPLRLKCVNQTN